MANDNKRDQDEYFEDRAGTDDARFHVVPHDEEGWAVKEEGNDEPAFTSGSHSEAVDEAKKRAEEAGTMVYIHGDDGKIKEQVDYKENK